MCKAREFEPKAHLPVPGALDLCFMAVDAAGSEVMERLGAARLADRRRPGAAHRSDRQDPLDLRA